MLSAVFLSATAFAQHGFVYTKEGKPILNRYELVRNCLNGLKKTRDDNVAVEICNCQIDKLNFRFTAKEFKRYSSRGVIDISGLIKQDSVLEKEIQSCFSESGKSLLIQAEGFEDEFLANCIKGVQNSTEKKTDVNRVTDFCKCQLDLFKKKKISDEEFESLRNPNSALYYEIIYKCGDPFSTVQPSLISWNSDFANDIVGPLSDTIRTLTFNGMTYLKMKLGTTAQIWLYDTGASDVLINREMEENLKKDGILSTSNYLGTVEYEMANGMVDTCRRYKVNSIQLGKFVINNVNIAVTDKGRKIIIGKSLLNKFSSCILNNRDDLLILRK